MSLGITGLIQKNIPQNQILDFIKTTFDKNAKVVNGRISSSGYISINDTKIYTAKGGADFSYLSSKMTAGNYTYLNMEQVDEFTIDVITKIVSQFGGGFAKIDKFVWIDSVHDDSILPVMEITQDELNAHFGAKVIVVNNLKQKRQ